MTKHRFAWLRLAAVGVTTLLGTSCSQAVRADYCMMVADGEGDMNSEQLKELLREAETVLDAALLPLGMSKDGSQPRGPTYWVLKPHHEEIDVQMVATHLGLSIAHFVEPNAAGITAARQALEETVERELKPLYLVRACKEIDEGAVPTIYGFNHIRRP